MDPGQALVAAEYTRMALVYEARVVPRFAPIARRTVALAGLQPGGHALDLGCGTGLATLLAAEAVGPGGEVVGVDLSEGQLGVAAGKAALRGVANVRWERRDALALPWAGAFDAVLSNLGLPPRVDAALASARRALRPGGRLSLATWEEGRNPGLDAFHEVLARHALPEPGAELAQARAARRERARARVQWGHAGGLREALVAAGFGDVRVEAVPYEVRFAGWREYYDFELSWGWTEMEVRALPGPDREALQHDLAATFGSGPFVDRWSLLHATAEARG